jgi:hypothetical protein
MAKYKIVKDPSFDFIYNIYKQILTYWKYVGYISTVSKEDEDIISKAKEKVTPKTIYFDA